MILVLFVFLFGTFRVGMFWPRFKYGRGANQNGSAMRRAGLKTPVEAAGRSFAVERRLAALPNS